MSRHQTCAVTLAKNILNGEVTQVNENQRNLLMTAGGVTSNKLDLDVLAHRVIRAFVHKTGFFSGVAA